MLAQEVLAKKRNGQALSTDEIDWLIKGISNGAVSDAQVGAFTMAVFLNGFNRAERLTMTTAMRDSGQVLDWDLPGPVVDKHSTGGVGDCVSLMLAPALAACGAFVPMISGRGLGHTGGTLDKFDAIPGYRTQPDVAELRRVVRGVGCAVVGQTSQIAPADKRLYAIRDITATVPTLDLITPSILSKKLAAGLDCLVLDVKLGTGAFMDTGPRALELAEVLVEIANAAGCKTSALITDMNQPLATVAGNALEMKAAVQFLKGQEIDARLWDVTVALGGELLVLAGLAEVTAQGETMIADAFQSGQAVEVFGRMVASLGGPKDFVDNTDNYLVKSPVVQEIYPQQSGFVQHVNTTALGMAVVELGGGRRVSTDEIDYGVGLDWLVGTGMHVDDQQPLARVHAGSAEAAARASARVQAAYAIGDKILPERPLIVERVR